MGSIGRYVFRTTMVAFLITLVSLTVVIWFTQAMREFDLITSQRQTLLVFVGITGLIVPLLVMMIAPIALVMAAAHVLNKLSTDSEIIVMNAAGVSPWRLCRPFLAAALVVSLLVAAIAAYISPLSLRELRDWGAQVRADILTNIVQPGRFTTVGGISPSTSPTGGRTASWSEYSSTIDATRRSTPPISPSKARSSRTTTARSSCSKAAAVSAWKPANAIRASSRSNAMPSICRNSPAARKAPPTIRVRNTSGNCCGRGRMIATYLAQPDQHRSELSDRLASPLYPLAFIIVAFAFLGPPQTTRQSRTLAFLSVITAVSLLRLIGFLSVIIGAHVPSVLAAQYVALLSAMLAGIWQISRGKAVEPGAVVSKIATVIGERIARAYAS